MKTVDKKENHNLALAISELIRRLSLEERLELMRNISWDELEEWKATEETLSDKGLMSNLKKGIEDERKGRVSEVSI